MLELSKIGQYANTVRHLRRSQIGYRLLRKLGGKTPLKWGHTPKPLVSGADISRIVPMPEIDFDPAFLARFNADELLSGILTLLHVRQEVGWGDIWKSSPQTPLWCYNMHYQEYLLPLGKRYLDTGDRRFLDKAKEFVLAWIDGNPIEAGGVGWDSYPISMRIVVWLAFFSELRAQLEPDSRFVDALNSSLAEQFVHLSQHLEKDLQANHYFENLKALVLLSVYFDDEETLTLAFQQFDKQVGEQVLPEGAHYELSPMYHKVILEGSLRVLQCLKSRGRRAPILESRLSGMCDFVYSMERGTGRTPLFNDSGDNVAKSSEALLSCARDRFGIVPQYRAAFQEAGYYLIERECHGHLVKIIFDTGAACPPYAMGHTHCDALSFECFVDGDPVIVNCGTYSYQDDLRDWFRSTEASSTVKANSSEQSQCWGEFRVANYGHSISSECGESVVRASFRDYSGNEVERSIAIDQDRLIVRTALLTAGNATCFYHLAEGISISVDERGVRTLTNRTKDGVLSWPIAFSGATDIRFCERYRAEDFGSLNRACTLEVEIESELVFTLSFTGRKGVDVS